MSGHSKWHNIQKTKGAQDAKRAAAFTKIAKEMYVAVKEGGGSTDPSYNSRLATVITKAKAANMPNDNIKRAIDRGVGGGDGADYEEIRYEGYGIGGAAVIIDTMTDNRTRTVAEVRHALSKNGGNLGTDGSVAFMFDHVGQFMFAPGISEDEVMNVALENGAQDVITDDEGGVEVICDPADYEALKNAFEAANLSFEESDITMRAQNEIELTGDDAVKMQKIIDMLEDLDDVQEVYTNAVMDVE